MSASWGSKLEKKLSALTDSASKESIQTLAQWIGFNRKHAPVIASVLTNSLQNASSSSRQWLYWQLLHEVLLLDLDTAKWDKCLELRVALGEKAVVPAVESLRSKNSLSEKLEGLVKQWDAHSVFGGPTLVSEIRRFLSAEVSASDEPAQAKPSPAKETPKDSPKSDAQEPHKKEVPVEPAEDTPAEKAKKEKARDEEVLVEPAEKRGSLSTAKEITYDFDSKDIPHGKVDSREFLDPCKAIATLQIARDLRNDSTAQLSSLLSNLPEDVKEACKEAKEKVDAGETFELPEVQIRDFSFRIPEQLLDMDLEEQLQNVRTLKDIVKRQRDARQQLIFLLIKSRCQFGAEETAQTFLDLEETSKKLKERKNILSDAMALEGLDFEADTTDAGNELVDLAPLEWFKPGDTDSNKRQRIEE